MANDLSAFRPTKFALKVVELLHNETFYRKAFSSDYEGEIKDSGDVVQIRTVATITMNNYTKGQALTRQDLAPLKSPLNIDQSKYFSFGVDSIDKLQQDIDTIQVHAQEAKVTATEAIETDLLSYAWKMVDGDNFIGTDYSTGTVAVAVTTGVVTGVGTTFTTSMVGCPFKALGHTKYYTISTFTSATQITIVDQGETTYSGGTIGAGATYVIKGAVALAVNASNIYSQIVALGKVLNKKKVPKTMRTLLINADAEAVLRQCTQFIPAVDNAYNNVVVDGMVGRIGGFDVAQTELVAGDNTLGYYILACHKTFLHFAVQMPPEKTTVVPQEVDPTSFMDTCKGLFVWGRRVAKGNEGKGAVLRATFS